MKGEGDTKKGRTSIGATGRKYSMYSAADLCPSDTRRKDKNTAYQVPYTTGGATSYNIGSTK